MTKWIYLSLLLVGCAPMPPSGVRVEWVKVPQAQIHDVCRTLSPAVLVYGRLLACSKNIEGVCRIYAPDFVSEKDLDAMALVGHELKHCFDKDWHDSHQVYR